MSDYISPKTTISNDARLFSTRSVASWREGAIAGWTVSLLLHATIFAAAFLVAARSPDSKSSALSTHNRDDQQRSQRAAQSAQRETQAARADVSVMISARQKLQAVRDAKQKQLNQTERKLAVDAPKNLQSSLRQSAQAQKTASEAQNEAAAAGQRLAAARAKLQQKPDDKTFAEIIKAEQEIAAAQRRVQGAQNRASAAQKEAARQAALAGEPFETAKSALEKAAAQQEAARQAQEEATESLAQLQQKLKDERDAHWQQEQAQKKLATTEEKLAAATKRAETEKTADVESEAKAAREEMQRAEQAANDAKAKARDKSNDAEAAQKAVVEAQQKAAQKQSEAQSSQQQAGEIAARVAKENSGETRNPNWPDSSNANTEEKPGGALAARDLKNKNLDELVNAAALTEKEIAELDRQIRAADLARVAKIPYNEALSQTESAAPLRQPLEADATQGAEKQTAKAQTAEARAQIRSMRDSAQQMLARWVKTSTERRAASGKSGSGNGPSSPGSSAKNTQSRSTLSGPVSLSGSGTSPARDARMMPLAQQDAVYPAKDLTRAMKQNESGGGVPSNARYGPRGGVPSASVVSSAMPDMNLSGVAEKAIAGRKVMKGGQGADWMFVDSWYALGPFPNPNRGNINRRFAPESIVDLDANYTGKDNRVLRWQFVQSAKPMIVPPNAEEYGIYYAYTELWFDQPRDLWVAIGSDDKSTVWLNDTLVWVSSDDLKGWNLGEGLRRLHFKQGLNRVLYRVENGHLGMAFSLVLCLKPKP